MAVTFRDLIARNKRNSTLLVVFFCLFTAAVVLLMGLGILAYIDPKAASQLNWTRAIIIGLIGGGIALIYTLIAYYSGSNMILAISGAKEIRHEDDPELFNVVEEMAIAAGVPMPKVYMIYDSAPNAFATGRDPQHGVVAITSGLRTKLDRAELQGVIAHEMGHIRNYDIRLMMLITVLIGLIVMLSDLFWQMLRASYWSGGRSRSSSRSSGDSGKGGGAAAAVLFVVAIILAIIAPILARIIQMAVSRQREYLADASAVEFTRYPQGLASALRKISADPDELEAANQGTAHLYIANPIKKFAALSTSMFASHPPMPDRIARLDALAHVG